MGLVFHKVSMETVSIVTVEKRHAPPKDNVFVFDMVLNNAQMPTNLYSYPSTGAFLRFNDGGGRGTDFSLTMPLSIHKMFGGAVG